MKRWPATGRLSVQLDFGTEASRLGEIAVFDRKVSLQFDPAFVEGRMNPSPVRMRLDTALKGGVPELDGLPGLLHDSLPDGWARLVLDRALRQQGYDPTSLSVLDRLALVGSHGSGALVYDGKELPSFSSPDVDFDTAAALVGKAPEEQDGDRIQAALTLARSLGGARPKANVWRDGQGFTTRDAPGATPWIVKFPASSDGAEAGAVEYAYSLMARNAGIEMPSTTLLPSREGPGYFAVERFDRRADGERLHMHSLGGLLNASAANSALGYDALLKVTGFLLHPAGRDIADIEQQIARMAFNVFARNRDDHVKNHAFLMDRTGTWRTSPAFDLTYSNLREHALLVGSAGAEPALGDMLEVARAVSIPDRRTREIAEQVRTAVADWTSYAGEAGVSRSLSVDIGNSLNPKTVLPPASRESGARKSER